MVKHNHEHVVHGYVFYAVWLFIHAKRVVLVNWTLGKLLPRWRFTENSALQFVCVQETVDFWLVPFFCVHMVVWLYLPKQQQINGRQTQNSASLNLSAYVQIKVHPLSHYTEVPGAIFLYFIDFIFQSNVQKWLNLGIQRVLTFRGYIATSWFHVCLTLPDRLPMQLDVDEFTSKYHRCICGSFFFNQRLNKNVFLRIPTPV